LKRKAVSGIMLALFLIGMLTLAFNIQLAKAESTTIIVPDDYEKIQWAIGNASAGDTIFVKAGIYYEHIVVNKSLSLIGENRSNTIIDGSGVGKVTEVTADNVTIIGFTVRNGGVMEVDECAIALSHVKNCNISGNYVTRTMDLYQHGIYLESSSNNSITGNIIIRNPLYGVALTYSSNNNIVSGNYIEDNSIGIGVEYSSNYNSIAGNSILENLHGIALLTSCNNNTVSGNNITNNQYDAFHLIWSSNNTISGNNIANNNRGIYLYDFADNRIYHNNFIDNTQQVYDYSWDHQEYSNSINSWDDGYPSGGNYWSNYTGVDANMDGIGDSSYEIDPDNVDHYPLMGTFYDCPTTLEELTCHITTVCNSTISAFQFDQINNILRFNVTGEEGVGFCRACIPHDLIEPPYTVTVDGYSPQYVNYTLYDNWTHRWIYFTYQHSTHEVIITQTPSAPVGGISIPVNKLELLTPYIALTILLAVAVVTVFYVKKRKRNTETNS